MILSKAIAEEIAARLLEIGAVKLQPEEPFTWASGWKSPVYCDNRKTLAYPELRTFIKNALADGIKDQFPEVELIAGVATAGVPQGALVAEQMGLPFSYVRSKPKGHGLGNRIEGEVRPGSKVVLIEDLISTGGSSLSAVEALREVDAVVIGLAAIFTYGFPLSVEAFSNSSCPFFTLSDYESLLGPAQKTGKITAAQMEQLSAWRKSPATWGLVS